MSKIKQSIKINQIKVENLISNLIKSDKQSNMINCIFKSKEVKLTSIISLLRALHLSVNKLAIDYLTSQFKAYNIILINDIDPKQPKPEVKYIPIKDYILQSKIATSLIH